MKDTKKSIGNFFSRLFKHKQVEEIARELAETYGDEMRETMLSDDTEQSVLEDIAAEQVPMLEVNESGEVEFDGQTDNAEDESPTQTHQENPKMRAFNSEVRNHLITFRVNDQELEAINRRYAQTSFRSRGDYCRYSALTLMNVEDDTEDIKGIARYLSSIANSFNQIAYRVNKSGKLYDEEISEMKERLDEIWQLLKSIRYTRERWVQFLTSATQARPQTGGMLLAICAYLLHKEQQMISEKQESISAQGEAPQKPTI